MSLMKYFKTLKPNSASLAKQRLQILVAHERASRNQPSYVPKLQQELLEVIRKYVNVDQDAITVKFEQEGNQETMELNIVLPEEREDKGEASGKGSSAGKGAGAAKSAAKGKSKGKG